MLQTGLYLAKVNPKCYMYVFGHNSEAGEYGRVSADCIFGSIDVAEVEAYLVDMLLMFDHSHWSRYNM